MDSSNPTIRRYEDDLNVCGRGVIILAAWEVFKAVMEIHTGIKNDFGLDIMSELPEDGRSELMWVIVGVVTVVLAIIGLLFALHIYIGLNASKEATGRPYSKGYYPMAIAVFVLTVLSMFTYIDKLKDLMNIDTTMASIIVDLTFLYILGVMIRSAHKIRILRAEQTESRE